MSDPLQPVPVDPFDVEAPASPPVTRRAALLTFGMLGSAALLLAMLLLPVPYVVNSPGPTLNTLGEYDGEPLISITGAETYDSTGELRLTTVSSTGGPGFRSTLVGVVAGWLSGSSQVIPVEYVYPQGTTQQQVAEQNQAQMTSSQENATVAALEELGYTVPTTMTIAGTVEGGPAEGKLQEDDVLVAVDGVTMASYAQLIDLLKETDPGSTLTVGVQRDGQSVEVPIVTGAKDGGGSQLGVYIDPTFDLPVDVSIRIEDIGGSSAGTMFALGIIDRLTPQDEANGVHIAGTGTMDLNGDVGPIGGIRQKMAGSVRDGATWFLAPADNCDEVVGHVPDGLHVVRIDTLHGAREAVEAIGSGDTADLPTCTAAASC